jgi:hypothetical protein
MPQVLETLRDLRFVLEFGRYARTPGASPSDLAMSNFMLTNLAKGVVIMNCFLGLFYFAKFKNYRNSFLLAFHFPATYFGIKSGLAGIMPTFDSYLYAHNEMPCFVFEDLKFSERTRRTLSTGERGLIGSVNSLCYVGDYYNDETS